MIVDTTVMQKTIALPTDSRLLERSRLLLVKAVQKCALALSQKYNRKPPRLDLQADHCEHAWRFKCVREVLHMLQRTSTAPKFL